MNELSNNIFIYNNVLEVLTLMESFNAYISMATEQTQSADEDRVDIIIVFNVFILHHCWVCFFPFNCFIIFKYLI